jgi:Sodium:sulfate symporter transmembrane region
VGVLLFVFLPLFVYKIYPTELKSSPDVSVWAGEELKKMGRVGFKEISMALFALLALSLWIFGGDFINATSVAILVLSLMVMTRIVEWDDVLTHKQAWNVLIWFATLVTMADGLNKVGFLKMVRRRRGRRAERLLGDDDRCGAYRRLLRRPLYVCEPHRSDHRVASGSFDGRDCRAGNAG